ncbi:MAG: hypothetical protein JWM86_2693 [Thermoleophilia bacterium]|nr:hypothetical protein [Thermoleophilia bacterium]
MDEPPATASPTRCARRASHAAHALRNHLATLHAAATLIDDEEIRKGVTSATGALRIEVERLVVAARIDLARRPEHGRVPIGELLDWAARRARREGARPGWVVQPSEVSVEGPVPWLERLLADVLHESRSGADLAVAIAGADAHVVLEVAVAIEPDRVALLDEIARACGGRCRSGDAATIIELPRAS